MMSPVKHALAGAALVFVLTSCSDEVTTPPETLQPSTETSLTTAATPLSFNGLSGGAAHTCGLTNDNRAYCWGSGWLGDGNSHATATRPVPVAGNLSFLQVSAGGSDHICGVAGDRQAYCWGENTDGQLGDGTGTTAQTPVLVAGGLRFFHVDTEGRHTCGLTYPDQLAYCWGANGDGQLGNGTLTASRTPVPVSGGRKFGRVTVGLVHSCGITPSGPAYCWGNNVFGQTGDGDGSTATSHPTPVPVAGGKLYRGIDAGSNHTCAVTTSYQAWCWGSGRSGQVGDGRTYLRFAPRAVAGGLSFERVTAGNDHSCGETTNNRAYCWGDNTYGGLGDGTTTRRLTPVPVSGGLFFSQVSAGGRYTCGRTDTGSGYCWGYNLVGQLGDGTTTNRSTPVPVADPM